MNRKPPVILFLLAALSLVACDKATSGQESSAAARMATTAATETRQTTSDTMSYEVSIAIAAANRKRALRDCEDRAPDERRMCRTEVESDWDIAKSALADLRGDQG